MSATNGNELVAAVERLTTLVAVAMTRDLNQPEAIELLGRASLSNERIAEVVGTTADTVRATRSRIRRAQPTTRRTTHDGADAR